MSNPASYTEPIDQRQRIIDAALHLMAEAGVHAMSMRRLAAECGLNVATLYHYFPGKADLLNEVVAQQDYATLLTQTPPVATGLGPQARLAAMVRWIWSQMAGQDDMWRLLLGESLRGDEAVMGSAAQLTYLFEEALNRWMGELFPDLEVSPVLPRVLRGSVYGFFIEYMPLPYEDRMQLLAQRADEIAMVLIPD
jgi:AcrR family transcriptional regulator